MDATPTAAVVAHDLAVGSAVVWLVLEIRQGTNRRPEGQAADRGSRTVLRVAYLGGFLVAVALRHVAAGAMHAPVATAWVGLALLWAGIALRLWSFRTLGRYFTFTVQTSPDQPVITDGPYRLVRHPSYLGVLLAVTGFGFLLGNWFSLVVVVAATTAGLVFRIRVEEAALEAELGDAYRAYAATHRRLVPLIW
jgi:protein-S-isoprenylcysteine O-methyltransferase Ste14